MSWHRLSFLSVIAFLINSPVIHGEPGFHRIDDESIPAAVREAAKSVFKVITPDSENHLPTVVIDMSVDAEKFRNRWDKDSWQGTQFEFCERNHLKLCPIFPQVGAGSAFLMGDNHTLFSVLHNFNDYFSAFVQRQQLSSSQEIQSVISNAPIPVLMTNYKNDFVFSPQDNTAKIEFFNPNLNLFNPEFGNSAFLFRLSDFVRLRLTTPLEGRLLKLAKQAPKIGDTLYAVGYPGETNDRQPSFGVQDSDGESLRITKGHVLSVDEWSRRTNSSLPDAVKKAFEEYMIVADFDVWHGDSGGPILNENGEVVGVIEAAYPDETTTPTKYLSGGVKIFDEAQLTKLWDQF